MKLGHGHPQCQVLLERLSFTIPCVHRKMVYLVTSITFLLVATFALFLVTILSASATPNIYFAQVTTATSRAYLRAGMWGACSSGFGLEGSALHGCTSSLGAYSLTATVSVVTTQPGLPQQYTILSLLGSHDTGPLVCYLVSFLLLIIAFGPWLYEVFSTNSRPYIARITATGLVLLSCILSWIGFAFGVRLAPALEEGIAEYNSRKDRSSAFEVTRGNAVWIGLVGCISITLASVLLLWRWRSFSKDNDHELSEKESTGEHGETHL